MYKNDKLKQITCIENLEENGETFDQLTGMIKNGVAGSAVREMLSWGAVSDLDPYTYQNILDSASNFNERIVYDDGEYVLTANEDNIVLYQYFNMILKDKLGNDIEIGDKVIWVDPDIEGRDLNRVWTIFDIQSEELVKIEDDFSEAEVLPSELILAKVIL